MPCTLPYKVKSLGETKRQRVRNKFSRNSNKPVFVMIASALKFATSQSEVLFYPRPEGRIFFFFFFFGGGGGGGELDSMLVWSHNKYWFDCISRATNKQFYSLLYIYV